MKISDVEKKIRNDIKNGKNVNQIKREIRSKWEIKNDYDACQEAYKIVDEIAGRV